MDNVLSLNKSESGEQVVDNKPPFKFFDVMKGQNASAVQLPIDSGQLDSNKELVAELLVDNKPPVHSFDVMKFQNVSGVHLPIDNGRLDLNKELTPWSGFNVTTNSEVRNGMSFRSQTLHLPKSDAGTDLTFYSKPVPVRGSSQWYENRALATAEVLGGIAIATLGRGKVMFALGGMFVFNGFMRDYDNNERGDELTAIKIRQSKDQF